MIERLRSLRDRALRAFSVSISPQERDPYAPPTLRDERLAAEREKLKRLFEELSGVQQEVIAMLEERSDPDAPYQSIEAFVDELDISDRTDDSE